MKNLFLAALASSALIYCLGCKTDSIDPEPASCIEVSSNFISISDSVEIINCNNHVLKLGDNGGFHYYEIQPKDTIYLHYSTPGTYDYTYHKMPVNSTTIIGDFAVVVTN